MVGCAEASWPPIVKANLQQCKMLLPLNIIQIVIMLPPPQCNWETVKYYKNIVRNQGVQTVMTSESGDEKWEVKLTEVGQ